MIDSANYGRHLKTQNFDISANVIKLGKMRLLETIHTPGYYCQVNAVKSKAGFGTKKLKKVAQLLLINQI